MSLPMNIAPRYEMVLPSTGQTIHYKPFLVKQQKALMTAMQSEDARVMIGTLKQIIGECVEEAGKDFKVDDLATFDVEYIFAQLRGKSIGEDIAIIAKCDTCDDEKASVKITLNTNDLQIKRPEDHTNEINLWGELILYMKYPSMEIADQMGTGTEGDQMIRIIKQCMDKIVDGDDVYNMNETSPEDIDRFIDNLTADQFQKIAKFFETMPKMSKEIDYKCPVCQKEQHRVLEGLQSFFG